MAEVVLNKEKRVITLKGVIGSPNATELETALKELINVKKAPVTIDVSEMDSMTSSGLRPILDALKILKRPNIIIKGANDKVKKTFEFSGVAEVFVFE